MKKGYLLVEIMVSLSIFTLITVSTAGALLALIDANLKSQGMKSVMDNLNVAVENMSRTIRLGADYTCNNGVIGENITTPLCNGLSGFSFIPQDVRVINGQPDPTDRVYYYVKYNATTQMGTIYRWRNLNQVAMTAPEVNITGMHFYLFGTNPAGGDGQPRLFITISGKAGPIPSTQSIFDVQTTVSQRQPDAKL